MAQPAPQTSADQEQRRAEERDRVLRDQQEKTPDVRLRIPEPPPDIRLRTDEAPCFVIRQLEVGTNENGPSGSTGWEWLASSADGPGHDDSPLGRCLGTQAINLVLKRLQDAAIAKGYVTTRVLAQPQDLSNGVLIVTVIPGRINAVRFADGSSSRANAVNAFPARPGDLLNLRDIEQALENFKRAPTAEADIQIEPAAGPNARPGDSDVVISYKQALPFRVSAFADNSGSKATGKYQGGVTLSTDNLLTLNDLLYASFSHDLGGVSNRGTSGSTAGYSLPWGYWLLSASASANEYHQSVAGANQTYIYSGSSNTADVRLARLIYRDAVRKTTVGVRAFRRASRNFIDDTEILVQRRVVGGFEASANHREFIGNSILDLNYAYRRGTGAFGSLEAPEEAFGEGTSRMRLSVVDINFSAPFKAGPQAYRYTGLFRRQYNSTPLTPQDRFSIGGRYTVRGFDGESTLLAERGWLLRNDLAAALGTSGQEIYAGLDYGHVSGPSAQLLLGTSLAGAVLGLRGSWERLQYDVFIGHPLHKPDRFQTARNTVGFTLSINF